MGRQNGYGGGLVYHVPCVLFIVLCVAYAPSALRRVPSALRLATARSPTPDTPNDRTSKPCFDTPQIGVCETIVEDRACFFPHP